MFRKTGAVFGATVHDLELLLKLQSIQLNGSISTTDSFIVLDDAKHGPVRFDKLSFAKHWDSKHNVCIALIPPVDTSELPV